MNENHENRRDDLYRYYKRQMDKDENPKSFSTGPQNIGDPSSVQINMFEIKFCIPAKMREIIFREHCPDADIDYRQCKNSHKFTKFFRCKSQRMIRNDCISQYWDEASLKERAEKEYLIHRKIIRTQGIDKINKNKNSN